MKKNAVIAIVGVVCLLVGTGIGKIDTSVDKSDVLSKKSKGELISMVHSYDTKLSDANETIKQKDNIIKGVQKDANVTSAIGAMNDGTGRLTFNSISGKIVFPEAFNYPNATQTSNTSAIMLTSAISIVPGDNWVAKLRGTTLDLSYQSGNDGIDGTIKAGSISDSVDTDAMKSAFSSFFTKFPPETITYSKVFVEDNCFGMQAVSKTRINGKDGMFKCGMVGVGNVSMVYAFVYQGEQDSTKDELSSSLLKTIKISGQQLRFE